MSVQFDFSGKCRRAGSARERLHLSVRANVSGQIGQSGTLPRTEVTLERQLFGVPQKVFLKRVGAGERSLAHFTLILCSVVTSSTTSPPQLSLHVFFLRFHIAVVVTIHNISSTLHRQSKLNNKSSQTCHSYWSFCVQSLDALFSDALFKTHTALTEMQQDKLHKRLFSGNVIYDVPAASWLAAAFFFLRFHIAVVVTIHNIPPRFIVKFKVSSFIMHESVCSHTSVYKVSFDQQTEQQEFANLAIATGAFASQSLDALLSDALFKTHTALTERTAGYSKSLSHQHLAALAASTTRDMKGKKQFKYEQAAVEALKTLLARADFGRLSDATVDQLLDKSFQVPLTVSLWNAVLAAVVFYAPAEKLPQLLSYLQYSMVRQLGRIKAVPKSFFGHFIPQLWELMTYCRDIQRSDWYRHQTQSNDDANNNDEVGDAQSSPPPPQPEPYKVCKLNKRVKFPISFMPVDPQDPDQKRVTPAMESFECAILGLLAMLIDMVSGQEEAETLFLCKVATKKSAKKDAKKNTEKVTKKVTKEATKEVIKKATKKGAKKNTKRTQKRAQRRRGSSCCKKLMADVLAELAPLLETLENGNILENSDEGLTAKQLVTIESAKMGLKALMRARNELSENLFDEHLKINLWDKVDSQISSVATAFKAAVAQSAPCQKAVLSLKTALLNFTEWSPTRDTAGERPLLSRHTATNRQMFASYPKSKIPHGSYFSVSGNFDMSYHAYLLKNGPTTPEATLANSTAAAAASSQTLHCIEVQCLTSLPNALLGFATFSDAEQWPNLYVHGWPSSYLLQTATLKLVLCSQTEQGVIEVPTNLSQLEGTEAIDRTFPNGRSEMVVTLLLDRSVAPAVKNTFSMCRFLVNGVEVIPIEGSPEYAQAMAELAKRAELKTPFDACPVLAPSNFNDLLVYFERKEWKYAIKGAAGLCARGLVLTPFVSFTEEEGGQAPVEADEAAHHVGDYFRTMITPTDLK
ncbi:hypothetical protein TYRP_009862 [Tyrophagus putrescentiae]|nr:hypothetical protein TYRP_009862 [Tyrophagus putrescentiae]